MRLALLGLAVAVLGLLAVAPVVPQPVDLLLLEAELHVVLERVVGGVAVLRAVAEVDGGVRHVPLHVTEVAGRRPDGGPARVAAVVATVGLRVGALDLGLELRLELVADAVRHQGEAAHRAAAVLGSSRRGRQQQEEGLHC